MPEDGMLLRQAREIVFGAAKLLFARLIEADDDFGNVGSLGKLGDDVFEGGRLEFGIERRQDQRDGARSGKDGQFFFHPLQRAFPEIVQGRDHAVLVKIRHI